jgi:hypothetical protein
MNTYTEPPVSFLVLDFQRPQSARLCLESIRRHTKFPHKIIYCHNGLADYPLALQKAGLIDELIMPRENGGLGLGTRALFAACFSPLAIYWQVDQIMGRDFTKQELDSIYSSMARETRSVGLAGPVCGDGIFTERAFVINTEEYRWMEHNLPLTHGGAGPYAHVIWREEQIQKFYKMMTYKHKTDWPPLAIDNGRDAVRQNPDGSVWRHEPDRKGLELISGPVKERYVYPKFTPEEWDFVIATQSWPRGQIPEQEKAHSFHVWN